MSALYGLNIGFLLEGKIIRNIFCEKQVLGGGGGGGGGGVTQEKFKYRWSEIVSFRLATSVTDNKY